MSCRKCNRVQIVLSNMYDDYYWKKTCECGNHYELCNNCHLEEFEVYSVDSDIISRNGIKCKMCERKMKLERIVK